LPDADAQENYRSWLGATEEEDAAEVILLLKGSLPDWMIVDHYGISQKWHRRLRGHVRKLMVIDDLANRAFDCDLLLNQNSASDLGQPYFAKIPSGCQVLLGTTFALLHPEYADLRPATSPRSGPIRRIMVYFGGTDPYNLTCMAVRALVGLRRNDLLVDVVLPGINPQLAEVQMLAGEHPNIRLHSALPTLAPLMASADLAIGAAGATSWERCCMGLPSVVVLLAQNQIEVARSLQKAGVAHWIGNVTEMNSTQFQQAIEVALSTPSLTAWSERCFRVCDGRGAERVADEILGKGHLK
jgi:UDP-2,4-diacetamido-2,4,6-trideoxy-beta-L-altropyranose hydrolase